MARTNMPEPRVLDVDALCQVFHASEKPIERWRVGMEAEKFGLYCPSKQPLTYEGARGVVGIFDFMIEQFGYEPRREKADGPIIALEREGTNITLEPGAQFELSGSPQHTLHAVFDEFNRHHEELQRVKEEFGVRFVHLGFNPLHRQDELPWVPKVRYPVMKEYLPRKGARGLDMMRRTATVQANLDYASETDAMGKLVTLLRLSPIIAGMTLNAPLIEGRVSRLKSERQDVWLHMDPSRSGLIDALWKNPSPKYTDYVHWALDAGMFLFYRNGSPVINTGQTFRTFMEQGFEGYFPNAEDWELHIGTLFPQVRLKRTIEVRCCDCLPLELSMALPALAVGLTYDDVAYDRARALAERVTLAEALQAQAQLPQQGLATALAGTTLGELGKQLLEIAEGGLQRRALFDQNGRDETQYLEALGHLVHQGLTPADRLLDELSKSGLSVVDFVGGFCR